MTTVTASDKGVSGGHPEGATVASTGQYNYYAVGISGGHQQLQHEAYPPYIQMCKCDGLPYLQVVVILLSYGVVQLEKKKI